MTGILEKLKTSRMGCILEQTQVVDRKWYVALTKPRQEETAKFYLSNKGVDVFYPKLFIPLRNTFGRPVVPLFPNYIFVHIDVASTDYFQVVWCRGVKKLVNFGERPWPVEDSVIDFLREQADPRGLIVAKSVLKVGDEVQITKGPFEGLIGVIQEPPDAKSRVKVLMAILGRQVQVEVPANNIDIGWVVPCPVA